MQLYPQPCLTQKCQSSCVGAGKGLEADKVQASLRLNTWKKISRARCLESSESVLWVLNIHNPFSFHLMFPIPVTYLSLIHMICMNRLLQYTSLGFIKAPARCLEWGTGCGSHQAAVVKVIKRPPWCWQGCPCFRDQPIVYFGITWEKCAWTGNN